MQCASISISNSNTIHSNLFFQIIVIIRNSLEFSFPTNHPLLHHEIILKDQFHLIYESNTNARLLNIAHLDIGFCSFYSYDHMNAASAVIKYMVLLMMCLVFPCRNCLKCQLYLYYQLCILYTCMIVFVALSISVSSVVDQFID